MIHACTWLLAISTLAADAQKIEPGLQLAYRGHIARVAQDGAANEPDKNFELTLVVAERDAEHTLLYWTIEENGRGAWPWPERFGKLALDGAFAPRQATGPAVLYDRGEATAVVPVIAPLLATPPAKENQNPAEINWTLGDIKHQVEQATKLEDRDTWQVLVSNPYGRKRVVWVEPGGPLVVGFDERVFMGQGEEYTLSLRLAGNEPLAPDALTASVANFEALLTLRDKLSRPPRSEATELTGKQLDILRAELPALESSVRGATLQNIVAAASRDVQLQSNRTSALARLMAEYAGRQVEKFQVAGLEGQTLSDSDLSGNVTVLHFWDYRDAPLKEPYGQVGYLDFLYEQQGGRARIFGIAVDSRLGADETRAAAVRSVGKLKSFMNLGYPVLLDEGSLLKKFGDPRLLGAGLPLFVVIGTDGKIVHYHVGLYDVDREAGLKQLDEAVMTALRAKSP